MSCPHGWMLGAAEVYRPPCPRCSAERIESLERELADVRKQALLDRSDHVALQSRCESLDRELADTKLQRDVWAGNATEHAVEVGRLRESLNRSEARCKELEAFAVKVDCIRNTIIGSQSVNWSRDIYPLVAALDAIGLKGLGYETARAALATDGDDHG